MSPVHVLISQAQLGEWCCAVCSLAGTCSEEAVDCFRRLLELDAGSGPALLCLGVKALEEKKYEDATKSLSQGECVGHDISDIVQTDLKRGKRGMLPEPDGCHHLP